MSFHGARVLSLESRRAAEMAELIRKQGGDPFVAPSMREVAIDENDAVFQFAESLFAGSRARGRGGDGGTGLTASVWQSSRAKLRIEMRHKAEGKESGAPGLRLPTGVFLKPPVSEEDLKADTEYDPEGAEEFVALIRALRKEGSRPVTL